MNKKSVVVASGGLDSTVALAYALDAGNSAALLHVNYGQRTEARELEAFHAVAGHYGITDKLVVDIGYLREIGGSSLTDTSLAVEEGGVDKNRIPSTYVPFRNGNILSIAVSWAEVIGASSIYIGAVEEDSSGYPDCRQIFYDAFNRMLEAGLPDEARIKVETPLIHKNKSQIVSLGIKLKAPLDLTWSCYQSGDAACGVCDSCRLRLAGFQGAGMSDPITYRTEK